MKRNHRIASLILAATVSLGAASLARAQTSAGAAAVATAPEATAATGPLGSRYTAIAYNYLDLSGTGPNHAHGFEAVYNQPLSPNFDVTATYDWARASYAGSRYTQQDFTVGTTAYTNLEWGKPFALAALGWNWSRGGAAHEDSFLYRLGVGVELPVSTAFSVTPFVNFARATGYNHNQAELGVKAEYRFTREWSVMARAQYDAISHTSDQSEYALGVSYRF